MTRESHRTVTLASQPRAKKGRRVQEADGQSRLDRPSPYHHHCATHKLLPTRLIYRHVFIQTASFAPTNLTAIR